MEKILTRLDICWRKFQRILQMAKKTQPMALQTNQLKALIQGTNKQTQIIILQIMRRSNTFGKGTGMKEQVRDRSVWGAKNLSM